MDRGTPIVRLTVERMQHSIMAALDDYGNQLDNDMQDAIDATCTPDNVQAILNDAVDKELKLAIENEVRNFFKYGNGQKAIKAAVCQKLDEQIALHKEVFDNE